MTPTIEFNRKTTGQQPANQQERQTNALKKKPVGKEKIQGTMALGPLFSFLPQNHVYSILRILFSIPALPMDRTHIQKKENSKGRNGCAGGGPEAFRKGASV